MLAKDLLSDTIPALKPEDTGITATTLMDDFKVSHLPVVNNNNDFMGIIAEDDIYDQNIQDERIKNFTNTLLKTYVQEDNHLYQVIAAVSIQKLTTIPVLNKNNKYLGLISLPKLTQNFAKLSLADEPGGILVLELNVNDYSLSEISQIVEWNDAKILSVYVASPEESMKLDVTLKINRTDLNSIIQTFVRYEYVIKTSFSSDKDLKYFYQDRYDNFLKYLSL